MNEVSRLVGLLQFMAANPGIRISDAARATGRSRKQLMEDLDRLMMCGVPPYEPHDYVSFRIGAGADAPIEMQFAKHFAQPLTFTPPETLALCYALEHSRSSANKATTAEINAILETLRESLHGRAREVLEGAGRAFAMPRRTDRLRELISTMTEACAVRRVVEIDYYSAHRGRLGTRRVRPFQVIDAGGHFYLFAHCELAGETRHFRIDRVRAARLTDTTFTDKPPRKRDAGRLAGMFEGKSKDQLVVRFSREVAQAITEEWTGAVGTTLSHGKDGSVTLITPLFNQFWVIGFVSSFGAHAEIVGPTWLRAELEKTLRQSLKAHA